MAVGKEHLSPRFQHRFITYYVCEMLVAGVSSLDALQNIYCIIETDAVCGTKLSPILCVSDVLVSK